MKNISIIIVTYNGKELLEKYLPSVVDACKRYSLDKTELIIVDNASSDGTIDYLRLHFPFIKLIQQPANKGFSNSVNLGVSCAQSEIVVLLNDDIRLSEDFLLFLPQHFEDKSVFAVRPGIKLNAEDRVCDLKNLNIGGAFKFGIFDVPRKAEGKTNLAFFVGGGGGAFDKEKFTKLGGFDEIFYPFYYEDVDLCYRAWKRKWKIIYEPRSLLYHQSGATISKFYNPFFINIVAQRNRYLLVWKNVTDQRLLFQHFIFIPINFVISLLRGQIAFLIGLLWALKYLRQLMKRRKLEKQAAKLKDSEIFNLFKT